MLREAAVGGRGLGPGSSAWESSSKDLTNNKSDGWRLTNGKVKGKYTKICDFTHLRKTYRQIRIGCLNISLSLKDIGWKFLELKLHWQKWIISGN
jgi:hypothetical protein